jgi:hypothetical protein
MRGVARSGLAGQMRRLHRFRCYESVKTRNVVCIVFFSTCFCIAFCPGIFSRSRIFYYPTVLRTVELFKNSAKFS